MIEQFLRRLEDKMYVWALERIVRCSDVVDLLSRYGRNASFLRDLLHRLRRVGNAEAIHRASSLEHLRNVLLLYGRQDWTEEDKFVATSNYLEYGKSQYVP